MHTYTIYTDPIDTPAELLLDNGTSIDGKYETDAHGAHCTRFEIPLGSPDANGARLNITAENKAPIDQHGILYLRSDGTAEFSVDVFWLQDT